jgi:hypothetical protein
MTLKLGIVYFRIFMVRAKFCGLPSTDDTAVFASLKWRISKIILLALKTLER